jgi:type IV secretory pathway TraG/TraD family ATPase VirD4
LGYSTGQLAQLSHGTSLAPHQHVTLTLEDATQNILILGGIGSGKTTRAMHPLLIQLFDQACGGLIFDIKGDFQKAVLTFAKQTAHPVVTIGPGYQPMNLLAGLTPEIAASFLKSVFMLSGKHYGEAFWIDTATELCRNTLGLLSFLPVHYSLQGLYSYLFDTENRLARDEEVEQLLPTLNEKERRLLNAYWQYHNRIFDQFDEKVKAGVNATIAQILAPFNHPELIDAFCCESENTPRMEDVLTGAVYLVSLPLSIWGLGGKVVYTFIKLRFYNVMQQRAARSAWNQTQPVFFLCDEFQEIVSTNKEGLSDLNFWDKSRSSKTIGIISAQAVSSFYALLGDRDMANALLQNFRQKICFRTEDTTTLNYFNYLADKVEVIRKTYSSAAGTQEHPAKFLKSKSESRTENTTIVDKPVLDAQLFRKLKPDQAVALLSVEGHSMDDVINMLPVYVEPEFGV